MGEVGDQELEIPEYLQNYCHDFFSSKEKIWYSSFDVSYILL